MKLVVDVLPIQRSPRGQRCRPCDLRKDLKVASPRAKGKPEAEIRQAVKAAFAR